MSEQQEGLKPEPKFLSQEEFLKTFENAPRAAANLIVKDKEGRALLTRRNIPPDVGKWHFPGGFILKMKQ